MATFVALYEKPEDTEAFEQHYRDVHMPILQRWPGVRSVEVVRLTSTPRGGEPPYHLMATATFDSVEQMQEALRSEAGAEAAQDARTMMERFGVGPAMLLGEGF